ncbi:MAG: DUF4340 domain-containing protein [Leptospiraceae bacterium]|nr:DUF4340 domain-containing protein [Leptospiraceae bacterium]
MQSIREYRGAILLGINVCLVLLLVFGQNALNLFASGYAGASPLVDAAEDEIARIEIRESSSGAWQVQLERGDKHKTRSPAKDANNTELQPETPKELLYDWQLRIGRDGSGTQEYAVDRDRLRDLIEGLQNVRDYYGLKRDAQRERELQMTVDDKGQFQGLQIALYAKADTRPVILYVGHSKSGASQSYVRLDNQDTIYLVDVNLRSLAGSGEADYFRKRRLFGDDIKGDSITMLDARYRKGNQNVQIAKQGQEWVLIRPQQMALDSAEIGSLLRDIADWKADSFHAVLPDTADSAAEITLQVYYNAHGTITDQLNTTVRIVPKKDSTTLYYVQPEQGGDWYELSSIYLSDLAEASERYQKRPALRTFPTE